MSFCTQVRGTSIAHELKYRTSSISLSLSLSLFLSFLVHRFSVSLLCEYVLLLVLAFTLYLLNCNTLVTIAMAPLLRFAAPFLSLLAFSAAKPIDLGTAATYGALGGSSITNTGSTVINGDIGVTSGNTIAGFPPGVVTGTIHSNDAAAAQAQSDALKAYKAASALASNLDLSDHDLGGQLLTPAVYSFASSAQLTGVLVLDALGDPTAQFIFQISSSFTTTTGSQIVLHNGACAGNVFFVVGSGPATLGAGTQFNGNIISRTGAVVLNTGVGLNGGVFSQTGAIVLDTNQIQAGACAAATTTTAGPTPTPTDELERCDADNCYRGLIQFERRTAAAKGFCTSYLAGSTGLPNAAVATCGPSRISSACACLATMDLGY
jgi:hypothetical protein